MNKDKIKFISITSYDQESIIESFINGNLDLYLPLRNIQGTTSYKNDIGLTAIDVTGICKLTDKYKRWEVFKLSPGKVILENHLEIIEPQNIAVINPQTEDTLDWNKGKKDNFFVPCIHRHPSKALQSDVYGMIHIKEAQEGEKLIKMYAYTIPTNLLLLHKVKAMELVMKSTSEKNKTHKTENSFGYFDKTNIYTKENATLIENILDANKISIRDLASIFNLSSKIIIDFFQPIFNAWLEKEKKDIITLQPFCCVLANIEDRFEPLNQDTLLISDRTMAFLIDAEILPKEICRLPRYSAEQLGFTPLQNFYDEYCNNLNLTADNYIKNPFNFEPEKPVTLTYEEVVKFLEKNDRYKSELENACLTNRLGVFLRVEEKYITNSAALKDRVQSLDYFRKNNCGNPGYLIRHNGLEKLPIYDSFSFSLETLFLQGYFDMNQSYLFKIELQTTDFETKFQIRRLMESFNGRDEIKLSELLFIKEEVQKLFGLNSSPEEQKTSKVPNKKNSIANSTMHDLTLSELDKIYKKYKEKDYYESNTLINKRLRNKAAREGIIVILDMLQKAALNTQEALTPLHMRGQRDEFFEFIENLYPTLYQKENRDTLYEIVKSKKRKNSKPLLGWGGLRKKPDPEFWQKMNKQFSL